MVLRFYVVLLVSVVFYSCSPYATGPVSMRYHNLTAKYNAYFLARERLKELEDNTYAADANNFYNFLNIYPKTDCTFAKANKDKFDKILKNASWAIQWHKPSHWIDDCYLVVGKIRFYDFDLENAVTTFRYIHLKYNEPEVKHETLIWLMKTYMWMGNYEEARRWGDFLENEAMSPKNLGYLSLANGHYYIKQNDYQTAYLKLKVGVPYVRPRQYRAKMYYLLGQLAQKIGKEKEAFEHFKKCSKMVGNYEMWLYAKLNMHLMKELKTEKDYQKTMKFYKKELSDVKNTDYYDKIYYDMATIEQRRQNLEKALEYYKESVRKARKGTYVKAFAYLRCADIYYDDLQQYENAAKYYDSTITVLEKELPEYPRAFKRQRILKDFVEQLRIIRTEDSVQKIAVMPKNERDALISKWIAEEDRKLEEQQKEQKRKARSLISMEEDKTGTGNNNPNTTSVITGAYGSNDKWYFYNPEALERGKQDFLSKWGDRPNEDNWRRINKERQQEETNKNLSESVGNDTPAGLKKMGKNKSAINSASSGETTAADARMQQYYDQLPLTQEKLDTSNAKLSRAMYKLGRIYDLNLEEYANAERSYLSFVNRFPEHDNAPEALYAVYLICKNKLPGAPIDSCTSATAHVLRNQYPYSIYSKLVDDPDYLKKNQIKGEKVKAKYRLAFELYEEEKFLASNNLIEETRLQFPESDYEDRLELLRCMIVGRTMSWNNYRDTLQYFIKKYEPRKSKLVPYAKSLLEGSKKVAEEDKEVMSRKKILWDLDLNFPHHFCVQVPHDSALKVLKDKFHAYNQEFFTEEKLKIQSFKLEDSTLILSISKFPNKIQAMNYYVKQTGRSSPLQSLPHIPFYFFAISEKNFDLMKSEKSLNGYKLFFRKNYSDKYN